jgi:hypothetical protein
MQNMDTMEARVKEVMNWFWCVYFRSDEGGLSLALETMQRQRKRHGT